MADIRNDPSATARGATPTPKISWDDSKMASAYANVCNVASTREEIVLLFGINQAWQSGQKEVAIQLTNRMIMSPYTAKRLHGLLGNVLREYESRFGELAVDPRRAGSAAAGN
jgi:hypothetical protein